MAVIVVTFALPAESSGFVRRLTNRKREKLREDQIVVGSIGRVEVAIFHTGVGEKVCRRRMAAFLQDRQLHGLISAGFAGGLGDSRVGDLVIAENFSTAGILSARRVLPHARSGPLATVPQIVDQPDERARLARDTGALAVDMETEFIARACAEHGLRVLAIRAISDTPLELLPVPSEVLFDLERQKTNVLRLGGYCAKHPAAALRLAKFARRVKRVRLALTDALEALLRSDLDFSS